LAVFLRIGYFPDNYRDGFLRPGFSRILIFFFFFGIGFKNGFKKEEVD
jgi:hypothetical protein